MQDPRVTLTDDEVRDLFSAYHDGELPDAQAAAVREAIEKNPELARDYEAFRKVLTGLSNLGVDASVTSPKSTPKHEEVPKVDLLGGVQKKLHKRSGGRFYKDRWSRTAGIFPLEVVAVLVLLGLVLSYFWMTSITARPAPPNPPAQTR